MCNICMPHQINYCAGLIFFAIQTCNILLASLSWPTKKNNFASTVYSTELCSKEVETHKSLQVN